MTPKLGMALRGVGGAVWSIAEQGTGATGSGGADLADVEKRADDLAAMGAAEAVATLTGQNLADKMPDAGGGEFPGPVAEALFWDDSDVVGIQGPVGSGKTTTTLKSRLRRAIMMPGSTIDLFKLMAGGWVKLTEDDRHKLKAAAEANLPPPFLVAGKRWYKLLVVRETYRQLWSTTIPSYLESYPKEMGTWSGGRGDPVTHVIEFDDGNGPIEFRVEFMAFGDDVIASMRGVQTTDIWLNETDTVPIEVLTAGIGRIDRWPGIKHFEGYPPELRGYGQIICDFNAPDEENWTYRLFHATEERDKLMEVINSGLPEGSRQITITFHNQPGYGEPGCENLQNLSASYYPRQIASMKMNGRGDMLDRLVYNKITYLRAGEPVFAREFRRRIHVNETTIAPEPGVPLLIGLDQGFKGAAVVAQFLDSFHWRILAELHFPKERLFGAEFGRRLRDLLDQRFAGYAVEAAFGDIAGESGAAQAEENATWNRSVAKAADIRVRPQRVGANRLQPRLEAVRAPLEFMHGGAPGLLIDPSCRFLIRGFEARYVWTDEIDASGDKRKVPDKRLTEANVMDALQYLLLSKSRGDGLSPISFPEAKRGLMGHNGGPRWPGEPAGGLITGFSVMDPYGE